MVLGIQDFVGDSHLAKQCADELRFLDRDGTDENRLALLVDTFDFLADGPVLELLVEEHEVVQILTDDRQVSGDDHDIQVVDLVEFGGFGVCRSGHARELVVHSEEVLERDGCQGLVLAQDPDVLLGLDGLMQTVGVASSVKDSSCKFIYYLDLIVGDDIVGILVVEVLGDHCLGHVMDVFEVLVVIEGALDDVESLEQLLHVDHTFGGKAHALGFLIQHVVAFGFQLGTFLEAGKRADDRIFAGFRVFLAFLEVLGDLLRVAGLVRIVIGLSGDDQRCSGLIDEDRVYLVYDAVVVLGLDLVLGTQLHVVTQVIETEFVVGSVCHVAAVGLAASLVVHVGEDHAHGEAQEAVDRAHPLGVTLCQVVVDGDDVDAFAFKGIEVACRNAGEGLSFTCLEFQDLAFMQDDGSHDLHVVVALAQNSEGGLPYKGVGLGKDLVQSLAVLEAFAELLGLEREVLVLKALCPALE